MDEEHENCIGDNCRICEGYELFQSCIEEGADDSDAFHDVVSMIIEDFANTLVEAVESDMSQGYILAMRDVANNATEAANRLEEGARPHEKEEEMPTESDLGEHETETTIFIEGDLSEEEISEMLDRVNELSGEGAIEVVNVECGVSCECEPATCLFEDYNDNTESVEIAMNTLGDDAFVLSEDFLYGKEFVKWMEDRL